MKSSPYYILRPIVVLLVGLSWVFLNSGCVHRIIDEPVFIVGGEYGRAGLTCNQEFEAVPSSVTNPTGDVKWFASLGYNRMTYAKGEWSKWSGGSGTTDPGFAVPINPSDPFSLQSLFGDSWSTYSETKNLAFFYFIGKPPASISNSCVAVAATAPENLEIGVWDFPATCLSQSRGDQCAILHIDETHTFYSACAFSNNGPNIRLQAFDDCSNAPGPAYGCPRTAIVDIPGVNQLQFSIAANPCTGSLVLVYRQGKDIRLRFYDEDLTQIRDFKVRGGQQFASGQKNRGCSNGTIRRCGLGTDDCCNQTTRNCRDNAPGQCLRDNARPSIDTYSRMVGGTQSCGAVLAYDTLVNGEDDNLWSKSRLDIVDITSETSPSVEAQWNSTNDEFTWNQYLSYAVVTDKGKHSRRPKIAWFWLTDIRGACSVIAEGATSTDLGASMQATGILSGPFPGVYTNSFGLGDYFRGIKGGDHDGDLFLTWGEPVKTSRNSCVPCMQDTWNLSTKITRIRWERTRRTERDQFISPAPIATKTAEE